MLRSLRIKNLAVIESVVLDFSPTLNALTGETGAGKSIVVGGLELALGERCSTDVIRAGQNLALAEATFDPPFPPATIDLITGVLQLEYQQGEPLVLRRELLKKGRSRCFVNDQMINVGDLKRIGELLVDLHGQHEHQSLFHPAAHRASLDACAGHDDLLDEYRRVWESVVALRRRKTELEKQAVDFEKRLDYLDFQIDEIEKTGMQPGEIAELEKEEKRLSHAEYLARSAADGFAVLSEGVGEDQPPVIAQVGEVSRRVQEIVRLEPDLEETAESLGEALVILEDVARSLENYAETVQADPGRLNEVITRLEALRRLVRKHGDSEESLFSVLEEMRDRRRVMTRDGRERGEIDEKLSAAEQDLVKLAKRLTRGRKKTAEKMSRDIQQLLRKMAMEKAKFDIQIEPLDEAGPEGVDRVEFLLAANPGLPPAPLKKVASGGELSRTMLAIKSVLAARDAIPTLVFDEIDAGISGEVCRRVAQVMEKLAKSHQIICITHHAAIAARAESHLTVQKTTRRNQTFTELVPLQGKKRLEELARMLGGRDTTAAKQLASQLMK